MGLAVEGFFLAHVTLQLTGRAQSPHGRSSLLSTSTLTSLSMLMPWLPSRNGQGWHINDGGVVDYQRQWRDFVLQSVALAAAGIVVNPPLLNLVPAVQTMARQLGWHLHLQLTRPDCQGSPTKFTSTLNLVVRGEEGQACHWPFWGCHAQDGWEFSCTLRQPWRRQSRVPSYVGLTFYRGEVSRVFFIMRFCPVLKWMQSFHAPYLPLLIILPPQNTKQSLVLHFDKMHSKYCREALSGNSIQGGPIGNPNGKSGTSLFVNSLPLHRTITTSVTQGRGWLVPYAPTPMAISIQGSLCRPRTMSVGPMGGTR
jgi:hypothetical protein